VRRLRNGTRYTNHVIKKRKGNWGRHPTKHRRVFGKESGGQEMDLNLIRRESSRGVGKAPEKNKKKDLKTWRKCQGSTREVGNRIGIAWGVVGLPGQRSRFLVILSQTHGCALTKGMCLQSDGKLHGESSKRRAQNGWWGGGGIKRTTQKLWRRGQRKGIRMEAGCRSEC